MIVYTKNTLPENVNPSHGITTRWMPTEKASFRLLKEQQKRKWENVLIKCDAGRVKLTFFNTSVGTSHPLEGVGTTSSEKTA